MSQAVVGVGAGQHQQHPALPPKVHQVLAPLSSQPPSVAVALSLHAGDVRAVVGFGNGHGTQGVTHRQLRQPVLFLFLGAAFKQGAGENFRPGDQATGTRPGSPGTALR